MDKIRWDKVNIRYEEPPQEYIEAEMRKYASIVEQYCLIAEIDPKRVKYNSQALKDVIIRVDMRGLYFRIFHEGMKANEYKLIIGLECFWILKLKPFWMRIEENDNEKIMQIATWINEEIAMHMACSLLQRYNPSFFKQGLDICTQYCNELEYSFRYRDLSKESMFLMFDPFYFMKLIDSSVTKDGQVIL
ncbi:MAG: hypothetical protein NC433_05735 [Clostridiales bacterium]|nr:hypothetical protein [Clostridiales bacterium]